MIIWLVDYAIIYEAGCVGKLKVSCGFAQYPDSLRVGYRYSQRTHRHESRVAYMTRSLVAVVLHQNSAKIFVLRFCNTGRHNNCTPKLLVPLDEYLVPNFVDLFDSL